MEGFWMLLSGIAVFSAVLAVAVCLGLDGFATLGWLWILPVSFAGSFVALAAVAFVFVWIACAVVDQEKPQGRDSAFYRKLTELCVELLIMALRVRVDTVGLEKTPRDGRFLLVCNHLNDSDPGILLHFFRKSQLAFVSKQENKDMFLVGKLMHKISCQLVNRENDREALKTILKCIQLIKEDKASVAVFPEGYTSRDHKFHNFRHGVFKIAQKTKVPVVICTVTDTYKVFGNAKKLQPTDVDLHVVSVMQPEEYEGLTAVEMGERIHAMMAADLGAAYAPEENA